MPERQPLPPDVARRFRTGRPSLDFSHTGGEGPYAVFELLHEPGDVAHWLAHLTGAGDVRAARRDVERAQAVRNAIARAARDLAGGRPVAARDAAVLNDAAATPPPAPQLTPDGTVAIERGATAAQALSALARDAIDILGGPLASRIRICAAEDCGLLFVDQSRPGTRRWCSMERCGNRTKTRAYRRRGA